MPEKNLSQNIADLQKRIEQAATLVDRDPRSVQLLAVSKTQDISLIKEAIEAGQHDFGENRVQELKDKQLQLPDVRWHMIGRLQRNKVKFIAPFVYLIHSVDSPRLLAEISKQAVQNERMIPCLLQMDISGEEQKAGMSMSEVEEILNTIDSYPGVEIKGLMGMATHTTDANVLKAQFQLARKSFEYFKKHESERVRMKELSMGMSGDFELAIGEGATIVRIGSAVFR